MSSLDVISITHIFSVDLKAMTGYTEFKNSMITKYVQLQAGSVSRFGLG